MRSTDYITNLNKNTMDRPEYLKKIEEIARKRAKKWCTFHPTATWAEGFERCVQGHMKNEECKEGKQD
jgi:hypothetical protein